MTSAFFFNDGLRQTLGLESYVVLLVFTVNNRVGVEPAKLPMTIFLLCSFEIQLTLVLCKSDLQGLFEKLWAEFVVVTSSRCCEHTTEVDSNELSVYFRPFYLFKL